MQFRIGIFCKHIGISINIFTFWHIMYSNFSVTGEQLHDRLTRFLSFIYSHHIQDNCDLKMLDNLMLKKC